MALRPDGAHGWAVDVEGEPARHARHLVVATDVPATRDLVAASPELVAAAPGLARRIAALPGGEPYVVARLFCEGDVDPARAAFTGVTRERVLDSVTLFHRLEGGSARWAPGTRGLGDRAALLRLPAGSLDRRARRGDAHGARRALARDRRPRVIDIEAHRYTNAPGFDPGYHLVRPGVLTDARGLRLAGDWVACDVPSALMERAAVTAVTAANDVLREEGVRPEPMRSIRPRGVLAASPGDRSSWP